MNKKQKTLAQCALISVALFSTQAVFADQTMGGDSTMTSGVEGIAPISSLYTPADATMTSGDVEGSENGMTMTSKPKKASTGPLVSTSRFPEDNEFQVLESIDEDALDTEGDLWTESDVSIGNADHVGDLVVIGDLDIGNANINGNLYVRGTLTIGNGTVSGNVIVEGDFEAGNAEIGGYTFVTGNLNAGNTEFNGPVYAYGKKSELDNGTSGTKLKIAGSLSSGNMTRRGAIYVFGKKSIQNASGKAVAFKGTFAKVDPFLQIDISAEDLSEVKALTEKYDKDVKALKASLVKEMKVYKAAQKKKQTPTNGAKIEEMKNTLLGLSPALFEGLTPYVEAMDFDMKGMSNLAAKELAAAKKETAKYKVILLGD